MKIKRIFGVSILIFFFMFFLSTIFAIDFNEPDVINIITDNTMWQVKEVKDFNNDTLSDLLFQHSVTGEVAVWFMNSDGTKNSSVIISDVNLVWKIKAVEDLDKDGIADILWQHSITGKVAVWFMNSNGTSKAKSSIMGNTVWRITNAVDFNNDSIYDLIFQHPINGKISIMFMNSNGSENTSFLFSSPNLVWKIKAVYDLDKDSITDILWQHSITGKVAVWFMNSDGTQKTANTIIESTVWRVNAVKDFNNDNILDLLFQHPITGKISILFMNSNGTKNSILDIKSPNLVWKIKSVTDFNNDTIPDLIFQHHIAGKLNVWLMSYNNTLPPVNISICTSFNYTNWSNCSNGTQTREVISSSPELCVDGDFEISQTCEDNVSVVILPSLNLSSNKTIIPEEEIVVINETIVPEVVVVVNETNNSDTLEPGLTCEQIGLSLNFLPENILCICPTCEVQPPTICSRMGFFDLTNSSDCTYCCGKTS